MGRFWGGFSILVIGLIVSLNVYSREIIPFDKPINVQEWNLAMRMSPDELLKHVSQKVDVFRIPADGVKLRSSNAKIPLAPAHLLRYYTRAIQLEGAVGIYVSTELRGYLVKRPTILLRNDTGHWALIHEYTHHLFNEARTQQNINLAEDYETTFDDHAETLEESYQHYVRNGEKFSSAEHLAQYILCLRVAVKIRTQMLLQFEAEELAVEAMIRDYYKKTGQGSNYDPEYDTNSIGYQNLSAQRIITSVDGLLSLIDVGQKQLSPKSKDYLELSQQRTQLKRMKQQARMWLPQ